MASLIFLYQKLPYWYCQPIRLKYSSSYPHNWNYNSLLFITCISQTEKWNSNSLINCQQNFINLNLFVLCRTLPFRSVQPTINNKCQNIINNIVEIVIYITLVQSYSGLELTLFPTQCLERLTIPRTSFNPNSGTNIIQTQINCLQLVWPSVSIKINC